MNVNLAPEGSGHYNGPINCLFKQTRNTLLLARTVWGQFNKNNITIYIF